MAFTVTLEADDVWGVQRVQIYKVTADGAEANITTPFNFLKVVQCQPEKGQTMPAVHMNKDSSGVAANGTIGVSATSSGNIFRMMVSGH